MPDHLQQAVRMQDLPQQVVRTPDLLQQAEKTQDLPPQELDLNLNLLMLLP
jgi:hypothetical protein